MERDAVDHGFPHRYLPDGAGAAVLNGFTVG